MIVTDKNLVVLPEVCSDCEDCFRVECQLCRPCFTDETRVTLAQSYWEHHNKMDFLRIFPPPIVSAINFLHTNYFNCETIIHVSFGILDKKYDTEGLLSEESIADSVVPRQMRARPDVVRMIGAFVNIKWSVPFQYLSRGCRGDLLRL